MTAADRAELIGCILAAEGETLVDALSILAAPYGPLTEVWLGGRLASLSPDRVFQLQHLFGLVATEAEHADGWAMLGQASWADVDPDTDTDFDTDPDTDEDSLVDAPWRDDVPVWAESACGSGR